MSRESERRLDRAVEELVAALAEHVAASVDERAGDERERPLSVTAAAAVLGIGRTRLYALMRAGELTGYLEGRRRLFAASEIRRYRARVEIVRVSD